MLFRSSDRSDKGVYRYRGTSVAVSRVLKNLTGGAIGNPAGLMVDGDQMWVADAGNKSLWRYSLTSAFTGTGTLNAAQLIKLNTANGGASGLAFDASNFYVLDLGDKQFYRYSRTGTASAISKVLRDTAGLVLGSPSGAVLVGQYMWIVDYGKDRAYKYSLSALGFGTTGTVNAIKSYKLYSKNLNAVGIAASNNYQALLKQEELPVEVTVKLQELQQSTSIAPVADVEAAIPASAYPNPVTDRTTVAFHANEAAEYKIRIVDLRGKEVMMIPGVANKGMNTKEIKMQGLAQGSYMLMIELKGDKRQTIRVMKNSSLY